MNNIEIARSELRRIGVDWERSRPDAQKRAAIKVLSNRNDLNGHKIAMELQRGTPILINAIKIVDDIS